MAEFIEDGDIYPTMIALASGVEAEVTRSGLDPVGFVALQPGLEPVLDHVGNGKECSEVIVNLVNAYPATAFPTPDPTMGCATEFAYEVQVGIFRCAAVPTGRPVPKMPTAADQLNSTRLHLADMQAMKRAICKTLKGNRQFILRGFTPYGPSGGAVGGVWLVVIGAPE